MNEPVKIYFALSKIQMKLFINLKLCGQFVYLCFSTLYPTLPHNLIKDKLNYLIEEPSLEKALLTLHVTTETHFLLWKNLKKISCMVCQNVCNALTFLLDNIFI